VNYVLFFGAFLLVTCLIWLPMSSDRPRAPVHEYRHSFLACLVLVSSAWGLLYLVHCVPPEALWAALAGTAAGGITTTAVDLGLVEHAGPLAVDAVNPPAPDAKDLLPGVGALVGLVLTAPLWSVIVVLIWVEEPGPIFVARNCVGKDGVAARRLAFRVTRRELVRQAEPLLAVGRLVRRSRLEQLPHLVDVLVRAAIALRAVAAGAPRRIRLARAAASARSWRQATVRERVVTAVAMAAAAVVAAVVTVVANRPPSKAPALAGPRVVPQVFDPARDAVLPHHRVVAFYAVPGAAATGPAWTLDAAMLDRLRAQGAEYERLDPAHPVALGIDLVASVPDSDPGPAGTYSHRLDAETMDRYVEFCRANGLLLFLDLSFGWAEPLQELAFFQPYLELPFVHLAIDPEWMFPRRNGVPGVNLSNVRAADLNPLLTAVADIPARQRVPRKIVILHQYRPTGDGLSDPYSPGLAEIADKANLVKDPRVDVVVHVDSVGGWPGDIEAKTKQYQDWVHRDMARFGNFQYGGFKIFYQLESKNRLMTPREVMALQPAPMVVTYGN
jgi:hypothetical protein